LHLEAKRVEGVRLLPFYRGLTAIFVTFFAGLGLNAAARVNTVCSNKLVPFQTEFVKQLIKNPVEIYAEFYRLDQESLKTNDPHNIPVRKFFHEEIPLLRKQIEGYQKFFESINYKEALPIIQKLLNQAQICEQNEFGLLDYNVFAKTVIWVSSWVSEVKRIMREEEESWMHLGPVPRKLVLEATFKRLEDTLAEAALQLTDKWKQEEKKLVLLKMYQFPFFPITTFSELSRLEMVQIQSAPFWMRKLANGLEMVDGSLISPDNNLFHDDGHARTAEIDLGKDDFSDEASRRFKGWDEFYIFLKHKEAITRYIINLILNEKDDLWRLRLDAILFYLVHETQKGSIEHLSDSYTLLHFGPERSRKFIHIGIPLNFLNREEIEVLQPGSMRELLTIWRAGKNDLAIKQLRRWYKEGNGPEWSVIDPKDPI